jgi:hypothetical protein
LNPLEIKILGKNPGRQRCAVGFNSGIRGLKIFRNIISIFLIRLVAVTLA